MRRSLIAIINFAVILVLFKVTGFGTPPLAKAETHTSTYAGSETPGATPGPVHTDGSDRPTRPDYLRTDDIPTTADQSILPQDNLGEIVHNLGIENRVLSGDLDQNYVDPFSDEFKQLVVPVIPF